MKIFTAPNEANATPVLEFCQKRLNNPAGKTSLR